MIKAVCDGADGRKIVLLGITDMNIVRMREGKPIQIYGEEMGLGKIDIWIITGKDEVALQKTLAPLIGPETTIRDEVKRPRN